MVEKIREVMRLVWRHTVMSERENENLGLFSVFFEPPQTARQHEQDSFGGCYRPSSIFCQHTWAFNALLPYASQSANHSAWNLANRQETEHVFQRLSSVGEGHAARKSPPRCNTKVIYLEESINLALAGTHLLRLYNQTETMCLFLEDSGSRKF